MTTSPVNRYATPTLECDLVMKGGITSGVIYPLAICRLAETYRLRNIGGASAGAIAAVTAGAAEYGRAAGDAAKGSGFEGLAQLPTRLTEAVGPDKRPRLLSLFQPAEATKGTFAILMAAISDHSGARKVAAILGVVLRNSTSAASLVAALAAAAALVVFACQGGGAGICVTAALGALALLAVGLLVSAGLFAAGALRGLGPEGRYGICPGYAPASTPAEAAQPPLTTWLTQALNELAGVSGPVPITFGDLKTKEIALELMTTDLTNGRPYRLPFKEAERGKYFFSEGEWRQLFPGPVIDVMVAGAREILRVSAAAPTVEGRKLHKVWSAATAGGGDQLPFPDADALPLVVGARLSLSFPVLLQAVPLYAVDWSLKANRDGTPTLERCWFSDGGICSNLPIHVFDSLLPSRPTFALNLKGPHQDYPVQLPPFAPGKSERDNVWIPSNNNAGISESWNRFDRGSAGGALFTFLSTMIDTMQSWNDNLTMHYPGYRDRVVHISHTDEEGGLNLNMPAPLIQRLSDRGAAAGDALKERFDPARGDGWPNHLWVRYRTLLAMLDDTARGIDRALTGDLQTLFAAPPSYKFRSQDQLAQAGLANTALLGLAKTLEALPSLADGAPNPRAVLKGRPQSG
jgi:hypothetical protein